MNIFWVILPSTFPWHCATKQISTWIHWALSPSTCAFSLRVTRAHNQRSSPYHAVCLAVSCWQQFDTFPNYDGHVVEMMMKVAYACDALCPMVLLVGRVISSAHHRAGHSHQTPVVMVLIMTKAMAPAPAPAPATAPAPTGTAAAPSLPFCNLCNNCA